MKRPERRNLYRILYVQPEAPTAVIKASYRALMSTLRIHPDLGGDPEQAARINHAYEVLSDPARRKAYDLSLRRPRAETRGTSAPAAPPPGAGGPDPARWAADAVCPFCRAGLPAVRSVETSCLGCGSPLQPPPGELEERPELIGRRRGPRFARSGGAALRLAGAAEDFTVRLRDLSFTGLSVESPRRLPVESVVRVRTDAFDAVALVVQCLAHGKSYRVHARLLTMRLHRRTGAFVSTPA
jgi:curved DNA-binding protein CbpA